MLGLVRGLSGGTGRRRRLKISRRSPGVWVRFPPQAPIPRYARSCCRRWNSGARPSALRAAVFGHDSLLRHHSIRPRSGRIECGLPHGRPLAALGLVAEGGNSGLRARSPQRAGRCDTRSTLFGSRSALCVVTRCRNDHTNDFLLRPVEPACEPGGWFVFAG